MSDSVRPHRRWPTRLPHPWDSPGKNTGVGCHFILQCMKSESEVAQLCPTLATPWTAVYQAPLSMGFSRQKYWGERCHVTQGSSHTSHGGHRARQSLLPFSGVECLSRVLNWHFLRGMALPNRARPALGSLNSVLSA